MTIHECPQCKASVARNADYCPKCGNPISAKLIPCRTCGTPLDPTLHRIVTHTSEITGLTHYSFGSNISSSINRSHQIDIEFIPCANCGEKKPILNYSDTILGSIFRKIKLSISIIAFLFAALASYSVGTWNIFAVMLHNPAVRAAMIALIIFNAFFYFMESTINAQRTWLIGTILFFITIYIAYDILFKHFYPYVFPIFN